MITTSAEYKTAVVAPRQDWTVRAQIDYTDYNLDNSIAPIVSVSDRLSDDFQLADGIEETTYDFFASWEYFQWGQHFRSEVSTGNEKGALSEQLSDATGDFPEYYGQVFGYTLFSTDTLAYTSISYPRFLVTFSPRTVSSLKAVFDTRLGEWAEDFDIILYQGDTVADTTSVTGNTSAKYETDITPVLSVTGVEIIVYCWNKPISKAKIVESFTSISQKYSISDIVSMAIYEESEPDDSTVPIGNVTANSCNMELINNILDNGRSEFDNDNTLSILAGNVTRNRRISLWAELEDQSIPLGIYYSQKWNINDKELSAEVSGQDIISLMDSQQYTQNQFISPVSGIINETYTTTADFSAFTLDNVTASSDEMKMAGSAVLCGDIDGNLFGFTLFGDMPVSTLYCGTAIKQISYTYTPGTSVTLSISTDEDKPLGTNVMYQISYKTVDEWNDFDGSFVYTPEDISSTTQVVKIRAFFVSQSTSTSAIVKSITVTADEDVTLYSLAAKVLDDFDDITGLVEGNFLIDQSLGDVSIPNAYLTPKSFRDVLSLIAEAAAGRAYVDRNGTIIIEALKSVTTSVKDYDKSTYFTKENPVNPQSLYNRSTVVTKPLIRGSAVEELASANIEPGTKSITVFYNDQPADFDNFTSTAGVTVNSSTAYTWGILLNVTNSTSADIQLPINGYVYRVRGSKRISLDDTESTRRNGVIEYVIDDNPLIQSEDQANEITSLLIESYGTLKRQVSFDGLPDPSLEIGDSVTVDGDFFLINSSEIDFSGGQLLHKIGGIR